MHHAHVPSRSCPVDVERRRHRRIQVLLVVELQSDELPQVVKLLELSQLGARLQLARPVQVGSVVSIRRADVVTSATVAWRRGHTVGIRFDRPMDEETFLKLRRSG
jgi:hypothetical protein